MALGFPFGIREFLKRLAQEDVRPDNEKLRVMIHKAKDLAPDEKQALEKLVGRAIFEHEDISIRVLDRQPGISDERRSQILEQLREYFAQIDSKRKPVSVEQADEIINEALRSSRPGYRPAN